MSWKNAPFFRFRQGFSGITERTEECEDQMEYCFKEQGKELFEAVLNSKVNQNKEKSIREILAGLSPEELWLR